MHRLAVLALLVPATAAAEPDPGVFYASGTLCTCGVRVRGTPLGYGTFGFDLGLGVRVGDWWIRGALMRSTFIESTYGFLWEPHVGIEHRTYDNPYASAFYGLDAGMVTGSGYHEDAYGESTVGGAFVMPRAGIEGGVVNLRIRLSLELVFGYGHAVDRMDTPDMTIDTSSFMYGGNLELGFTVR